MIYYLVLVWGSVSLEELSVNFFFFFFVLRVRNFVLHVFLKRLGLWLLSSLARRPLKGMFFWLGRGSLCK